MYKIAFIFGNSPVYWDSVILALAVMTGFALFLAAWVRKGESLTTGALACPIALMLSLILSRLSHWYFRPEGYGSFAAAMTDFFGPGHALMGAFGGCILTACLLNMMGAVESVPAMLDCMSLGGCGAIALGRLSSLFTPDDRGAVLEEIKFFPLTYPAVNPTSGLPEYRFAAFFFQAFTAACIFAVLLVLFRRKKGREGDMTLLFLLLYCASQILWDSTRYDALRLRTNGFISAVQLLCALVMAAVLLILSIRMKKAGQKGLLFSWLLIGVGLGGAGGMEYYAQIRGDRAALAYGVMALCLALTAAVGVNLWRRSGTEGGNENHTKENTGFLPRLAAGALLLLTAILVFVMMVSGGPARGTAGRVTELDPAGIFYENTSGALADAVPGLAVTPGEAKHYRIAGDAAAPKPDKNRYGKASGPEELTDVMEQAKTLLDGQTLYFSTDTDILEDFGITYYLDETILTITWKQVIDNTVYTFSEVKIADPTQFRRHLAGGSYGSGKLLYPTEMASTVNSVVASSGDYFEFRKSGVIVYNGSVCRVGGNADSCFVDAKGDLSFVRAKDRMDQGTAEQYVADNGIQFSLAFGPILVENGELNAFAGYSLGEVDGSFSRAALCQMGELHYMIVNACAEGEYYRNITMYEFARQIHKTGCTMAYALDGGQTAAHMVGGVLVNQVTRGYQRKISDIIYFATAVPADKN